MRPSEYAGTESSENGFSMLELVIVVAIIIGLTAIAVFSLTPHKRSYAPDEEALQALSFFREAYHRALSQRQTQRVTIDTNQHLIFLTDEGRLPGGDEVEIIRGIISERVAIEQPTIQGEAVSPPAAPYSYDPADFNGGRWSVRFRADGSVVDIDGNPLSATVFFIPTDLSTQSAGLVRAVTLYGPTASVRMWRYNPDTNELEAGGR